MENGGDADDEEVQGTENLGIDGVPVHLVADGELVVRRVGVEEGEVAQGDATGPLWETFARQTDTVVAARHHPQLAQKGHYGQCHQILGQLPHEKEREENAVRYSFIHSKSICFLRRSTATTRTLSLSPKRNERP